MNKKDVVRLVARRKRVSVSKVETVVNGFLDAVALCLESGEDVMLTEFGKFVLREYKPTQVKHPATGEMIDVPSRKKVVFLPAPKLKDRLKNVD